jgi:hypothetical protein
MVKHKLNIDKKVPIPPAGWQKRKETNPLRQAAAKMAEGDSVVVENIGVASRFGTYLKDLGYGAVTRRQPDGQIRVWKVEAGHQEQPEVDGDELKAALKLLRTRKT